MATAQNQEKRWGCQVGAVIQKRIGKDEVKLCNPDYPP